MATPDTLTIHTDQGDVQLPAGSTLADAVGRILQGQSTTPEQVATAVNGQFVARSLRPTHALHDGDTVLCFSPITGG
jgi:sulfur carrier protein